MSIEDSRAALYGVADAVDTTANEILAKAYEHQQTVAHKIGALSAGITAIVEQIQGTVSTELGEVSNEIRTAGQEVKGASRDLNALAGTDPNHHFADSKVLLHQTSDDCYRYTQANHPQTFTDLVAQITAANEQLLEFAGTLIEKSEGISDLRQGAHTAATEIRTKADGM